MGADLWVHEGGGISEGCPLLTEEQARATGWTNDPLAVLAWALRNAGRERVVPIIAGACAAWGLDHAESLAEAVFDALNGAGEA